MQVTWSFQTMKRKLGSLYVSEVFFLTNNSIRLSFIGHLLSARNGRENIRLYYLYFLCFAFPQMLSSV